MKFLLGTHRPYWLWSGEVGTDVPLFVSNRTLRVYKRLKPSITRWALDSGGFSELSMYGEWQTSAPEYVDAVERYVEEIGSLVWAAPQDWMCEPHMIAMTGLSVLEHQKRTIASYIELIEKAPHLPFIPVLQGWNRLDYDRHVRMYYAEGIDLTSYSRVGVGSVCRRQSTDEIRDVFRAIIDWGVKAHGFGVKKQGLEKYGDLLVSSDSMAWSFDARRNYDSFRSCKHSGTCQNCARFALWWRERLLRHLNEAGVRAA